MASCRSNFSTPLVVLLFAVLASYLYGASVRRTCLVFGLFRTSSDQQLTSPEDLTTIADTAHCEDLSYHEPSGLIITACEDNEATRHSWFPPLGNFDEPAVGSKAQGRLKVVDPKTLQARTLRFENFDKPLITHGIDVLDDPLRQKGEAVYIFAVNHMPNREHYEKGNQSAPKSHSVVEVFHYEIGSETVRHVRSVWHPLMVTPNDIFALSPTSFFVTNDHYYREGPMRLLEDVCSGAKWTRTIYVEFTNGKTSASADDGHGVRALVALEGMHNNNGLGHGKTSQDVLLASATSGTLHLGIHAVDSGNAPGRISLVESIEFDCTIDNPSYFADPYANSTFDASGFVVAGLSKAADLLQNVRDPLAKDGVMVWMVTPSKEGSQQAPDDVNRKDSNKWRKRLLFEDDGNQIRTSSSAVLVANDPAMDGGRRRAQLFVSGFLSKNIVSTVVDL